MRNKLVTRLSFSLLLLTMIAGLIVSPNPQTSFASSHREAPLIVADPLADNTDTYAFRSTESGRSGFVTLIANWIPFQEPSGGPHFYKFDDTVLYEIYVDNTADGVEDVTYQFRFKTTFNGVANNDVPFLSRFPYLGTPQSGNSTLGAPHGHHTVNALPPLP